MSSRLRKVIAVPAFTVSQMARASRKLAWFCSALLIGSYSDVDDSDLNRVRLAATAFD